MEKPRGYEANLKNTGAQEVPALRKSDKVKKGTAHRGRDLRNGK